MILQDVQTFIHDSHLVSLADLELHFQMDGRVLQSMILKLIHKGRVRQVPIPERCHGCTFCHLHTLTFYEWVDPQIHSQSSQRLQPSIPCCQDQQSPPQM